MIGSPLSTRRRSPMTAGIQSQVVYTFDNANRLSQLQQGRSTTGFQYDDVPPVFDPLIVRVPGLGWAA